MAHATLSDIQSFLLQRIATHEALRAVIWLARHLDASVTTAELGEKLGIPDPVTQEALDSLVEAGLVRRKGRAPVRYRYQPRRADLDANLRRTLILIEQDELEVVRMLASNSIQRLRRMAYLAYAPALKLLSATKQTASEPSPAPNSAGRE